MLNIWIGKWRFACFPEVIYGNGDRIFYVLQLNSRDVYTNLNPNIAVLFNINDAIDLIDFTTNHTPLLI